MMMEGKVYSNVILLFTYLDKDQTESEFLQTPLSPTRITLVSSPTEVGIHCKEVSLTLKLILNKVDIEQQRL